MNQLEKYLGKKILIVDVSDKRWSGFVESYDPDDAFLDYQGESIDVVIEHSKRIVCFGLSDIKSIEIMN
jgi:hypothetical protein